MENYNACELFKIAKIMSKKINVKAPSQETLIMMEIEKKGKLSASELADVFHVTIPAIMHRVDNMINEGYIIKTVDLKDKRTKYFDITDKAKEVLKKNKQEINEKVNNMIDHLTSDEKKELFRLLNKLIEKED